MKKHLCPEAADHEAINGRPLPSMAMECGTCHRRWCARCCPTPASLCPYCCANGAGDAALGDYKQDRERRAYLAALGRGDA